ncbi:MAG: hypothetical protein RIC03_01715 [Cyclobacteriaceae bacterium]
MRPVYFSILILASIAIWFFALVNLFGENSGTLKYLVHLATLGYLTGLTFWAMSKRGNDSKVTFWKKADPDFLGGFVRYIKFGIGLNLIILAPIMIWSNWWPYHYNNQTTIYFYSEDRTNSLTVIDNGTYRFVTPAITNELPNRNFAQFDIRSVPELGDGVWICWHNNQGWDLTIDKAELLKSDLDTSKYHLHTELPTDGRGIPTEIKYRQQNCAVFGFYLMELSPKTGAIVEIK